MSRIWLAVSGALGGLAVLLGAFGAHALRPVLPLQMMTIFETAVRYHLFHALALLGTGLAMELFPELSRGLQRVAILFAAGILLFSGSLYGLAMTDLRWLGAVTPLGGVAWILAWGGIAVVFWRARGGARRPWV